MPNKCPYCIFLSAQGTNKYNMYTLSKDIYAAHFPKLFDIHKYLRVHSIFIIWY